jgi:2-polyprenyl-3-methyl-5-hydroxy-6-metoxy-1,4-benzoquinol methylase
MIESQQYTEAIDFTNLYHRLRQKEGRVYSDNEVIRLPDISNTHPHYPEWQLRKRSAGKLISFFEKKQPRLKILEIGCGNGWLSSRLAGITGAQVTGIDINFAELQQAVRVFSHISNLHFTHGDAIRLTSELKRFDIVIMAACIQYMPDLRETINDALKLLLPAGEIHILDSPLYERTEIDGARVRTAAYYKQMGYPEMSDHYFHHSLDDLKTFNYKILYRPSYINRNLLNNKNPFPWLRIKKRPD